MTMAIYSLSLSLSILVYIGYYCWCHWHCCCCYCFVVVALPSHFRSHPIRPAPYMSMSTRVCVYLCASEWVWVWVNWTKRNDFILYFIPEIHRYAICTCTKYTSTHRLTLTLTHSHTLINAHIKWDTMILIHFHRHVSCVCAHTRGEQMRKCEWKRVREQNEKKNKKPKWNVD